jgi:hypothetical protein
LFLNKNYFFFLLQLQPSLPTIDLFRHRHRQFSQLQYDKILSQQLAEQLDKFLYAILHDEHMSSFELVYQFLNRSMIDNNTQSTNFVTIKKKSTNSLYVYI